MNRYINNASLPTPYLSPYIPITPFSVSVSVSLSVCLSLSLSIYLYIYIYMYGITKCMAMRVIIDETSEVLRTIYNYHRR